MDPPKLGDLFLDNNYSVESLLVWAQENKLNLNQLRDSLIQHQQDLNQTSLDLFNNSYERFYKLSHVISCLAEPVQHLTEPLEAFRNRLADLCQGHDMYIDQIDQKLSALEDTCRNKEFARQLIVLINRRDRIEKQMANIDWTFDRDTSDSRNRSHLDLLERNIKYDLLERVNVELHHLTVDVQDIQPTHDELRQIKKSLETSLAEWQEQINQLKGYFYQRLSQITSSLESSLTEQPLSEISTVSCPDRCDSSQKAIMEQFKLKICMQVYALVTKCWSPEIHIEAMEESLIDLACRLINRFADWLSKLRLCDFRITGPATSDNNRQTNFLAKQDAIMRLLIEDCDRLKRLIKQFIGNLPRPSESFGFSRMNLIDESFTTLDKGLSNVRSLQHLIER